MYICKLCNKQLETIQGLARHIGRKHKDITVEAYYQLYINPDYNNTCIMNNCENKTSFWSISQGYFRYCPACGRMGSAIEAMNTLESRYGSRSPALSPGSKEKRIKTNNIRYGKDNFVETELFKNKSKDTSILNWGDVNYMKTSKGFEHFKKIRVQSTGYETPFDDPHIRELALNNMCKSNIKVYGRKYAITLDKSRERALEVKRLFFIDKIFNSTELQEKKVIPQFNKNEYKTIYDDYEWKCLGCNTTFKSNLINFPRCKICNPAVKGISILEKELCDFCKIYKSDIIENTYKIIPPKELDIYIPSCNIAIEFNGLYWHSELFRKNKYYHLDKTIRCEEKGIHLLHIFEDEWINIPEIIKGIILRHISVSEQEFILNDYTSYFYNDELYVDRRFEKLLNLEYLGYKYSRTDLPSCYCNISNNKIWDCGYYIYTKL
jgi:hypothetical protein